jgi:NitT/TauT family transport system permease protein
MKFFLAVATTLIVLLLWALSAWLTDSPLLLPSPKTVLSNATVLWQSGDLVTHVWASLRRLLVGLAIGVPLGAVVGCSMGWSPHFDAVMSPYVRFFNSIPALALVPFSLLWLGVTEASRYALLIYTISLAVLLSARQGVQTVPPIRLKAAATLGLSGAAVLFRVVIPSCFPSILAGIRTALGLGVMVIVAAEMLGAESGLGYLIMQARSHFNMANLFVGVIGLGLLSLVLDRLFMLTVDSLLPRWSIRRRI